MATNVPETCACYGGVIGSPRAVEAVYCRCYGVTLPAAAATVGSLKRFWPVDADNFWITTVSASSGRAIAQKIIKGASNGTNDAGAAHESWRKGPAFQVDTIDSDPRVAGWKPIATSNGAQDYALKIAGNPDYFIGSYHGGDAVTSQQLLVDGAVIDPTTFTGYGRKFEIVRTSTLTGTGGETISATFAGKLETDNVFEQQFTLASSTATMASNSAGYVTLGFADPRFSQISTDGGVTYSALVTTGGGVNALGDAIRSIRLRDPGTGDVEEITWTVSRAVTGQYVLFNSNYAKLYVPVPSGILGTWTVTRRDTCTLALPVAPTAPYTDTFDGAALSAYWKNPYSLGADNSVVTGGEWVLTSNGNFNRFTHALPTVPGVYQVAIDYITDGAYTGAIASIQRSDAGTNAGNIGATQTFNSTSAATMTFNVTITQGMAPVLMIDHSTATGRVLRIREMRITKTA